MILISDCFHSQDSEGCTKLALRLAEACKKIDPSSTRLVALGREAAMEGLRLKTNRLLLSRRLWHLLRDTKETVVYIPASSATRGGILRTFVLSRMVKGKLRVLFAIRRPVDRVFRWILRASGAKVLTLSQEARDFYSAFSGSASWLRSGVDTRKFCPLEAEARLDLRKRYGFSPEDRVLLHVGHMQPGRNLGCFLNLGENCRIVLVMSPLTEEHQDLDLRRALEQRPNIQILEGYQPEIQALYQMADVYVFPVTEPGHCIDMPLSVLEAIACGTRVVCSDYGGLKDLPGLPGLYVIDDFAPETLNAAVEQAMAGPVPPPMAVQAWDWENGAKTLLQEG